jgi:methyl-accepting chemotaxis protein
MLVLSLALGACAVVIGAGISFWLTRNVMRQLGGEPDYAATIAAEIASGDLTVQIHLDDERNTSSLMFAMRRMQHSLAALVQKVREGTDAITTASSEIAAGNLDLSARTEEQASSLEETAASMEELTATVQQNTESVRHANQLANEASQVATKGGEVVKEVVGTMDSINESSKRIVDIIGVIDGIAFQTNILALNAAVEAARAGEQGRGFAVVASEVRSLAQRSAGAAKEIKELIGDSVGKVDAGSKLVNAAGETMSEVVASVKRVTGIMSEIASAGQEQSAGIAQVNQAIAQMDQVTQQNAALVEEAAAAADSMQAQAQQLLAVVETFKLAGAADQSPRLGGHARKPQLQLAAR